MLTSILMGLVAQNRKASEKTIGHSGSTSAATLLLQKLRLELRQSRLVGVRDGRTLLYWRARMVNGLPQLDPTGRVEWLPGAPSEPEVAELSVDLRGFLRRKTSEGTQVLSNLGRQGSLHYFWNPGLATLNLDGVVGEGDGRDRQRDNLHPFHYQICLSNLE
ncbi:MAG: hypothetical protein U0931_35765 [Vulcanimicrobiota bacterium]